MSDSKLSAVEVQALLQRAAVFEDSDEVSELLRRQAEEAEGYAYIEAEAAQHIDGLWRYTLELCKALKVLTAEASAQASEKTAEGDELRVRFDKIEREIMEGEHTASTVFTRMRTAALYTEKDVTSVC